MWSAVRGIVAMMTRTGGHNGDMVVVRLRDSDAADAHRADVLTVWEASFGEVDDVLDWQKNVWDRHRARADFRLATAYDGDHLVGFSWGYTGERGQFWSDLVFDKLGAAATDWVGGHFEFVELAVLPGKRGHGIGGRLHDQLLSDLPHRRALLGTEDDPASSAVHLYLSRGWLRLGKQSPDDQVMGKILVDD